MEESVENAVQIISKLEPIDCEEQHEIMEEIQVQSNTDGNLQINAYEGQTTRNAGEYVTEDGSQKIIITEEGEAYIQGDVESGAIYVHEDEFDGNFKAEYTVTEEIAVDEADQYEFEEDDAEEQEVISEEQLIDSYAEDPDPDDPDFEHVTLQNENVFDESDDNYCSLCDRMFKSVASLKRHISVTHGEKKDEYDPLAFEICQCCGEPADSAHANGSIKCPLCENLFVLNANLVRHNSLEHPDDNGIYRCCECNRSFTTKHAMHVHIQTHPLGKPFSCKACNRDFTRKYHLERHVSQTGCDGRIRPKYKCQVCQRNFGRKDNLRDHLRAHAGQIKKKKTFPCSHCGKVFQGQTLLAVHERTHTGEKPYACDMCPKRFPSTGAMKKHRRMHTGEKPYQCMQCKRRFAAKETLNRHVRTHTGNRPHSCSYCGKSFIQAAQLRAHIFHHTGENAFTCPHCNRAFNRRVRLTTHIKFVHDGARPLECKDCDRTFFRKEDLMRHGMLHSGEKPFACEICQKSFAVKASLKLHMLTHRKEQPCSCEECGRAFIRQDCLLRHMRAKHRDVLEDIMATAEKKRLHEQLIATSASNSIKKEILESDIWNELSLTDSIRELLHLLVDPKTLKAFGWPDVPVDRILDSVIKRCGHTPASDSMFDYISRMRENAKLLFTVIIDDPSVKALLNDQTVEAVIQHVLDLARIEKELNQQAKREKELRRAARNADENVIVEEEEEEEEDGGREDDEEVAREGRNDEGDNEEIDEDVQQSEVEEEEELEEEEVNSGMEEDNEYESEEMA